MDYTIFENISIDDYLAMYSYKDSNFYNLCVFNNLKNLKEVFEFLEKNEVQVKNPNSRAEILGTIDILRYVYLNYSINYFDKINTKCVVLASFDEEIIKKNYLSSRYGYLLRRLGFSKNEITAIAEKLDYGLTIGDAIVALYTEMADVQYAYKSFRDYPVRLKKLELFVNHYQYNKENLGYKEALKSEIDRLIDERNLLNAKIAEKELELKMTDKGMIKQKKPQ